MWIEIVSDERRFEVDVYLCFFAVSTVMLIAGAAVPGVADVNARRILWTVSVFVEVCYSSELLC